MEFESKILNGLEKLSEVLKSLLWEKAKVHGISPIQIQILLFVSKHPLDICNVSYFAKEFSITKATVSDAVKILLKKQLLEKDLSPTDKRRYNLFTTDKGKELILDISEYSLPILDSLTNFNQKELSLFFEKISKLILNLNQTGIIQVQRSCYNCSNYLGNKKNQHFCTLLNINLENYNLKLDCPDFQ